jgi:hypothetical protein
VSTITLSLNVDQVNMVLAALGNAPYVQVAALVAEIQKQAQSQLPGSQDPVSKTSE